MSTDGELAKVRAQVASHKKAAQKKKPDVGLMDFIPTMIPRYKAPQHLAPLVEELERSWTESVRVTACAPPRHAKTETVLAFIALTLDRFPDKTLAYVTYEAHTAQSKSRRARLTAQAAGVQLAQDAQRLGEWRTPQGGGLIATGVGGPLTSQGVDILLVDDPYKNRVEAESPAHRRMINEWMDDVAETRIEPGGSAFIFHTRWHNDDLIAHVHETDEDNEDPTTPGRWRHILMPAIDSDGQALWPSRWPLAALEEKRKRVGEYTWASLYQGTPRARGGRLFNDVYYYKELPTTGMRAAIGVDLAYTAKTHADKSIAVKLYEYNERWYVADLRRRQVQAPEFSVELKTMQRPGMPMLWYCAGTEAGAAAFMQREGVQIGTRNTTADKFVRAQPVAAAWNRGHILIPSDPKSVGIREEDLDDFVRVVTSFTGVNDGEDDDVDALAAAFDVLPGRAVAAPIPVGTATWFAAEEAKMLKTALAKGQKRMKPWER